MVHPFVGWMSYFGLWLAFSLGCGLVGYLLGKNKGLAGIGFLLGAVLGFIGLILLFFLEGKPRAISRRALVLRNPFGRPRIPRRPRPLRNLPVLLRNGIDREIRHDV